MSGPRRRASISAMSGPQHRASISATSGPQHRASIIAMSGPQRPASISAMSGPRRHSVSNFFNLICLIQIFSLTLFSLFHYIESLMNNMTVWSLLGEISP